ncbi:phosphoethanolamine transferase [Campylobacter gastrosuis]|uniref:Sulfatase-like hydrolase/transferase n=1 Tax=Campylobacter gastrosuis TaxID=2974576 RepID=A0ABT7HNZ1_9BACT|nr:sulfatase-like hydrolase/transferase [Campylobacter gastrosuis]MDL0088539.1 sulfatase-like hydrolase/transferase [Campylobacter gastrosuis]
MLIFISYFEIYRWILALFVIAISLMPAAYLLYFSFSHKVFNANALMAFMQSNFSEAREYFLVNVNFLTAFLLIILVLFGVIFLKFTPLLAVKNQTKSKTRILIIVLILSQFFIYENANLKSLFIDVIKKELKISSQYHAFKDERIAKIGEINGSFGGVYLLVIGESENRNFMSLYGFDENTTPRLDALKNDENFLLFKNAYSNYVHTTAVLKQALTALNQYNKLDFKLSPSIIEVANRAGFNTAWLSNQAKFGFFGAPNSMLALPSKFSFYTSLDDSQVGFDGVLLENLRALEISENMLIVLHLMGSHTDYKKRYPSEFTKFGGSDDLAHYKNSVFYNDFVVSEILKIAKNLPNFKALVYLSDHGEVVGVGHDAARYDFEMTKIPLFIYFSDEFRREFGGFEILKQNVNEIWSNDLLFNLMSALMGVKSALYEPENDITGPFYDKNVSRFLTLHGAKKIANELGLKGDFR